MDSLLQKKYDSLQNAEDFECWYLVKQPTEFSSICYLVSILEKYQNEHSTYVFQTYVESKISDINKERHLDISSNYRALRIAAFYGLIKMETSSYQGSILTETYYEIKNRCEGNFENISTYSDIIQRQIEKMYASTSIDEKFDSVRSNFRLYPVLFLYKILLEIGYATNNYSISLDEYRYLVATSTTYNKFLETLLLVQKWRDASDSDRNLFSSFRGKFDNRFIQALKQLTTLSIDSSNISLKCECISEVAQKVFSFEKYLRNEKFDDSKLVDFLCSKEWLIDEKNDDKKNENVDDEIRKFRAISKESSGTICKTASQIIYYGVPGCGKSNKIREQLKNVPEKNKVRVVFHPEYTNAEFIGQILPKVNGHVTYEFNPGPFTQIIKRAYLNPNKHFYLVIEEINRGNAAAIFGDTFQLLDRLKAGETDSLGNDSANAAVNTFTEGWSQYFVQNDDVNAYIRGNENSIQIGNIRFDSNTAIRLPPNLSILATMNTSDQNVFTLDNAFQRRFDMELVRNEFDLDKPSVNVQYNAKIADTNIKWGQFWEWINKKIVSTLKGLSSTEDKRLGVWFVSNVCGVINEKVFAEKVLKYLWDDVFKFKRSKVFVEEIDTLEKLIAAFEKPEQGKSRFAVFKNFPEFSSSGAERSQNEGAANP